MSPGLTPPLMGTSHPQPSALSPGRGHCPVMRGLAPTTTSGDSLSTLTVTGAVRSPSVNRLGSLFNSINRSVTSAFSSFVAVNQPVPGVIHSNDLPPTPPVLQRQMSQRSQPSRLSFEAAPRRSSAHHATNTLPVAISAPQTSSQAARSSSVQERSGGQQFRDDVSDGWAMHGGARQLPLQPAPVPRRPRGGLPIHNASDPAPPYTSEPTNHFSHRGT